MTAENLNLKLHRGGRDVWKETHTLDLPWDRLALAALGGALGIALWRRSGWLGRVALLGGGVAGTRALMDEQAAARGRGWLGAVWHQRPWRPRDVVEEASDESFPASDAPAWTP